jgi:3-hydroxyisobutyrate dehydrogenase-like beta-hydroxyacid dehydrogenase
MGISVAASAENTGHAVYWVSNGRSPQTHHRAQEHNLHDAVTLAQLCARCSVIVSVCPPDAAEAVATQVFAHRFQGLYLDANAISPQRSMRIGEMAAAAGAAFVDGGIIGGPAWQPNSTWLYLSGKEATRAAACFTAGPLETCIVGDAAGKASALKMCFAAYSKGTTALLCAILAAAEAWDVRQELVSQWGRDSNRDDGSDFAEQAAERVRRSTAKAWRFAGEMEEIAATFSAVGVPGEFHQGAAEIYRRLAPFKDAPSLPILTAVLDALLGHRPDGASS